MTWGNDGFHLDCLCHNRCALPARKAKLEILGDIMQMEYYYAWKNNEKRVTLYKRACHVVARGRMNSCLIEFENGQRECVSRNAVKRLTLIATDWQEQGA